MGSDELRTIFEDKLEKQMTTQYIFHVDKYVSNLTSQLTEVIKQIRTQMETSQKLVTEQSDIIDGLRNQIRELEEQKARQPEHGTRHPWHGPHGHGHHGHRRHWHRREELPRN